MNYLGPLIKPNYPKAAFLNANLQFQMVQSVVKCKNWREKRKSLSYHCWNKSKGSKITKF